MPIDETRLPASECPRLDNTLRTINAKSASLIFSSGHMNAPASMFGHTFLRAGRAYESPLLSYAVNYAATIDRSDAAWPTPSRGSSGSTPGYFSILPYYTKVREYASMDQRDLWEYRTNLTEADVRRMTLHVLEMEGIYSDYYFLDENCSYDLLFLLEAARPSVNLTDRHRGFFVTPIDTLRSVLAAGLIDNVVFRPSEARKIRRKAEGADPAEIDLAKALASGDAAPAPGTLEKLPRPGEVRALDLAADYTQYLYLKREIPKDAYQRRYLAILSARSEAGGPSVASPPPPAPAPPESGHLVSRASLAAGARDGRPFLEAAYRPAYHSLEDPSEGFNDGSQIVFSEAAVRWYPKDDQVRLQRWDLIDIVSFAPRDDFFHPVSWKVKTGLATRDFPGNAEGARVRTEPRGRILPECPSPRDRLVLAETDWGVRPIRPLVRVRDGGSAGIARQVPDRWGVLAQVRHVHGVLGDLEPGRRFTASLKVPVRLSRNRSLVLEGDHGWPVGSCGHDPAHVERLFLTGSHGRSDPGDASPRPSDYKPKVIESLAEAADRRGADGDRAAGGARERRPAGRDRCLRRTDPPDDARLPRRPGRRRRAPPRPRATVGVARSPDVCIPPSAGVAVPRRAAAFLRRRAVHLLLDPRFREPVPPPGAVSARCRDRDPRPADRRLPPLRTVRPVPLHDGARHRPRRKSGAGLRAARGGGTLQDRRPLPRRRSGPFGIRRVLRRSARDPRGDGQVRPRQQRALPRAEDGERELHPQRGRPRPAPGGGAGPDGSSSRRDAGGTSRISASISGTARSPT